MHRDDRRFYNMAQGHGAGVTREPSVSVTAQERTEILLFDLGPEPRPVASTAPTHRRPHRAPPARRSQ